MRKPRGWGWVVPAARPGRGRGWRFIMRSISQAALAHDSSYNACFVVKGARTDVHKVLAKTAAEEKALNLRAFKDGERAIAIHVVDSKRRVICPALVYCTPREETLSVAEAHVWVHPSAKESASEAFRDAVAVRVATNTKADVEVEESDAFARIEIIGAKAFEIVQKLAPDLDFYSSAHTTRGIRRIVCPDARAAAWGVQTDSSEMRVPTEVAPTQAEYDESRRASRAAALERPWEETAAVGVKSYSATLINRGVTAIEGYTLIVSSSWMLPVWHGVCQTGARPVGITEWSWCAQRFARALFPDDYLDTQAGADKRLEIFDDILDDIRAKPKSKVSQCDLALVRHAEPFVKVRNVLRVRNEKLERDSHPRDAMVRVALRCPWSGQPTLGAEIFFPNEAQRDAWCVKKTDDTTRRRDRTVSGLFSQWSKKDKALRSEHRSDVNLGDVFGDTIGHITSVSAPAASVGLASGLIQANAVKMLTENFSRGKTKVFVMLRHPGKLAVPAEANIVVKATPFDEPWF